MMKVILTVLFLTFSSLSLAEDSPYTGPYTYNAEVLEVVDGDTIEVDSEAERAHGEAATERAKELLSNNILIRVRKYDIYNRILGRVFLVDGRDYSVVMEAEGFSKKSSYD